MNSQPCQLDHLVVTADSLQNGIRFIEQHFGCSMQIGGQHPRMGTHNALLRIGESCYLEVIAVDPAAPPVNRPRWFQLDDPHSVSTPRLAAWVLGTSSIQQTRTAAIKSLSSAEDPGPIQEMNRGDLHWQISIPDDGRLRLHGCMPSLIQWKTTPLPPARLPDSGIELLRLELCHPRAAEIHSWLQQIDCSQSPSVIAGQPSTSRLLRAVFSTPSGRLTLEGAQITPG
ncbi:MAG TPA: VOC family protein [Planctomycetaceae bacterium]|nr:VOC family protein [Planctomycetaceae bacterium]